MPRHSVSGKTDAVITSLRGPALFCAAAAGATIRQVEIWNTTAVAFEVGIRRWTANGGAGSALTEAAWDLNKVAPQCTATNTPTADHTGSDSFFTWMVGAAIGSGIIEPFGDSGIVIPEGTANGFGFYLPAGTAQHFNFTIIWDE
jgi:hypothetical protein